jgi:hypothetical protein
LAGRLVNPAECRPTMDAPRDPARRAPVTPIQQAFQCCVVDVISLLGFSPPLRTT